MGGRHPGVVVTVALMVVMGAMAAPMGPVILWPFALLLWIIAPGCGGGWRR